MTITNPKPVDAVHSIDAEPQVLDTPTSPMNGQPIVDTSQAMINDMENTRIGEPLPLEEVLYRINVGGPEIAALDGGSPWLADTSANNSPFLIDAGSNSTASFPAIDPAPTVLDTTPRAIYDTERWDQAGGSEMQWAFDVDDGTYNIRLYLGNGFEGTREAGERVFDVAIENTVPNALENIDLSHQLGHLVGGVINHTVSVTDGTLNLDFLHGAENPLVNGIEIIKVNDATPIPPTVDDVTPISPTVTIIGGPYTVDENGGQVQISLLTDVPVPSAESIDVTFEITPGTATAEEDYKYLSPNVSFDSQTGTYTGVVSIAGSSSVATFFIDILQDTVVESDEVLAVKIIDVSPNAEIGTINPVSVTITDDETLTEMPIRLEAEHADSVTNYRPENIGVASGGQVLTFLGGSANESGSATFGFNETPGSYDIVVGTFDENDGDAQLVVTLNDAETGTTTEISEIQLGETLGSPLANAQTSISPTVGYGVQLTAGDSITVMGLENGTEHARLDYIELIPVI